MLSCQAGLSACNGVCVNETSDPANCGACGKTCSAGQVCSNGACAVSCQAGLTNCSGACTNTSFDANNCGACAKVCPAVTNATPACGNGTCGYVCSAPYKDCNGKAADGCETNTNTDKNNCGACGSVCAGTCTNGQCIVAPPVCTTGTDPYTGVGWVVCSSSATDAWISMDGAVSPQGGKYHAQYVCQQLGYSTVSQQGGTCGNTCGYCQGVTSCNATGNQNFDGGGGSCGSDANGPLLCNTVMWRCTK